MIDGNDLPNIETLLGVAVTAESAETPSPAPSAAAPIAATSKGGAPLGNCSAMTTGRRSRRDLALANLPNRNCQRRRDQWHDKAIAALAALLRRSPSFAEIELLHAAARFEAIVLLAESRRNAKGLTFEQLATLDTTISNALASKQKLLVKLGLQPSESAAASDPYASLYDDPDDDDAPEAPQNAATASSAETSRVTSEAADAAPRMQEKPEDAAA